MTFYKSFRTISNVVVSTQSGKKLNLEKTTLVHQSSATDSDALGLLVD